MRFTIHGRRKFRRTFKVKTVLLDGVDVTRRCQIADTRRRRAYLLEFDADGNYIIDWETGDPTGRWYYGHVRIILKRKKPVAPARPAGG